MKWWHSFGWYRNENFKVFGLEFFEIIEIADNHEMVIVFEFQIAKFIVGFGFEK